MPSYFVTPIPYQICQELAKDVISSGKEYVAAPDMSNLLKHGNTYRFTHLTKLVKDAILKTNGDPHELLYAFAVPAKAIKLVDGRYKNGSHMKKALKKPSFYLVYKFMDEIYSKSSEINKKQGETLKKRILLLKEQLFDCKEDDLEYYLTQELAELSGELRENFSKVLIEVIKQSTADKKYSAFDFKFFSLDLADYA